MLKKIIFMIIVSIISTTTVLAFGVTGTANVDTDMVGDNLMGGFNSVVKDIKESPPKISVCAGVGEAFSNVYKDKYPSRCCDGLKEWNSGMDTRKVKDGKCVETGLLAGSPVGTCLKCGDGICDGKENICNCSEDCQKNDRKTKPVICTMDAKQCPDGSYVGRIGPNCKFKTCPGETNPGEKVCTCTKIYKPVCAVPPMPKCPEGADVCPMMMPGPKTYSNECMMKCDNAKFLNEGKCEHDSNRGITADKQFKGSTVFKVKNGQVNLVSQGILHNGQSTTIDLNSKNKLEIESSADGDNHKVMFVSGGEVAKINFKDRDQDVKVVDGNLNIGNKEVKIKLSNAKEKAKKAASAEAVLATEIKTEKNGDVNYVIKTQKKGKFLGLFNINLDSEVKINVETGATVKVDEPWYSFLIF